MSKKITIKSIAYEEAPIPISSKSLEKSFEKTLKRFNLSIGFLEEISGIYERRWWESGTPILLPATKVCNDAIEKACIEISDIDCIINTSVYKDYLEPTISVMVHNELGLSKKCLNFDISNACVGFSSAIEISQALLETKRCNNILIFAAESAEKLHLHTMLRLQKKDIDFTTFEKEIPSLTLGSGATAMILCRKDDSTYKRRTINGIHSVCDSRWNMLTYGKNFDKLVCDGSAMIRHGVEIANQSKIETYKKFGWNTFNPIDYVIPHQVSKVHTKILNKNLGIDNDKLIIIYPELGNIGPAAWPIALYKLVNNEFANKSCLAGSRIGIASMGSGFNCITIDIDW